MEGTGNSQRSRNRASVEKEQQEPDVEITENLTRADKIEDFMKDLMPKDLWSGVYARNLFPIEDFVTKRDTCCILNLDDYDEPGSHFVAVAKNGKYIFVYDSFASTVPYNMLEPFLSEFCKKNRYLLWKNPTQHQSYASNACAYFCIWFLFEFTKVYPSVTLKNVKKWITSHLKKTKTKVNEKRIINGICDYISEHVAEIKENHLDKM